MSGMPPRHHSVGDYEHMRPGSGGSLQSFYANQRHQPRQSEAEQMMQTKRRMAAQRERELRNYHQEQQYNRRQSYLAKMYRNWTTKANIIEQTSRSKANRIVPSVRIP